MSDVAVGHRSATVRHLGNIAIRGGRKIQWDPVRETIVGDKEAAQLTTKEYRASWGLPRVYPDFDEPGKAVKPWSSV